MSKRFPHVYSFRLSDEDAQKYTWLLGRFHLDSRAEKSRTFRCFLRDLHGLLMGMDFQARMPARAAAQVPEDLSSAGPGGSDVDADEDLDPYVEEPWENPKEDPDYSRLRFEAIEQLRMNGGCVDLKAVWAAVEKLKKKEARIQAPPRAESEQLIEKFP